MRVKTHYTTGKNKPRKILYMLLISRSKTKQQTTNKRTKKNGSLYIYKCKDYSYFIFLKNFLSNLCNFLVEKILILLCRSFSFQIQSQRFKSKIIMKARADLNQYYRTTCPYISKKNSKYNLEKLAKNQQKCYQVPFALLLCKSGSSSLFGGSKKQNFLFEETIIS